MRACNRCLIFLGFCYQTSVWAADKAPVISATGSLVKVTLGLGVVLALMALVAWFAKRYLPGGTKEASAVKMIGSTSVGSRERVVVLEIADRWIVVGVAPGQVNAIANLAIGTTPTLATTTKAADTTHTDIGADVYKGLQPMVAPFAEWLKKSTAQLKAKLSN